MSKGYNDFFKAAREGKKSNQAPLPPKKSRQAAAELGEQRLRDQFNIKTKVKPPSQKRKILPPAKATAALSIIFMIAGLGYSQPQVVEGFLSKVEILPITTATAADEVPADQAKQSQPESKEGENVARAGDKSGAPTCIDAKEMSEEDLSHFKRLSDRKLELDQREQELNALEEELHKQRAEVETRIQKLEGIRGDISSVLKDRVEVDQERVKTLVEFYSNMKPKQAADIFANLNEDLAVEVLTKMKKKNAAEIMNLLPPEKARTLSEKFTGYKRR
jgi:flagellar motility protein MotE (MotC chaperone)